MLRPIYNLVSRKSEGRFFSQALRHRQERAKILIWGEAKRDFLGIAAYERKVTAQTDRQMWMDVHANFNKALFSKAGHVKWMDTGLISGQRDTDRKKEEEIITRDSSLSLGNFLQISEILPAFFSRHSLISFCKSCRW